MGVGLPVVFGLILQFRDQFGNEQGILYLAFLLGSAWWSDIGGYFTGMLCGKHKLCPEISPKKTVEGLIGGLIFAILGNIGIMALINWLLRRGLAILSIRLLFILVVSACLPRCWHCLVLWGIFRSPLSSVHTVLKTMVT